MKHDDMIRDIRVRYRLSARSLNERERRRWAAMEVLKLGRGGITIVSQALRISPNTIKRGIQETAEGPAADSCSQASGRIRKPGGGRKPQKTSLDRSSRPK